MAFGMSKPARRRRNLSDFADEWVCSLEPGVKVEGNLKAGSGLIRLNAHFKGDQLSLRRCEPIPEKTNRLRGCSMRLAGALKRLGS
jgi:hypothetical protein